MRSRWGLRFGSAALGLMMMGLPEAGAAPTNLAANAGFEEVSDTDPTMPAGWDLYTSKERGARLNTTMARTGSQGLELRTQGAKGAELCVYQAIPAGAREQYEFLAFVRNNPANPLGEAAHGVLAIEWWDANDREIGRVESEKWNKTLTGSGWQRVSVRGRAPHGTASAHFVVYVCDGLRPGAGSFVADDVQIARK